MSKNHRKNKTIQTDLDDRIRRVSYDNEALEPYINNEYQCLTCGTVGKSNPITSFCFVCDADNWTVV